MWGIMRVSLSAGRTTEADGRTDGHLVWDNSAETAAGDRENVAFFYMTFQSRGSVTANVSIIN